jgi:glutamyl-tRNA reductase
VNHSSAPVEVRERVSLSGDRLLSALADVRGLPGVEQAAILSTCNRTELYLSPGVVSADSARGWLAARLGLEPDLISPHIYELKDRDVAGHLCGVASGLNSQVMGESEILGQVKGAAEAAKSVDALGPEMEKLFAAALKAGKRVRSETAIGRGAFSLGHCAVDAAKRVFVALEGRTVLVLGAGKMGESTARHLRARGADPIVVANRTHARAEELAAALGGRAIRYDQLGLALLEADIVVSSTAAPHFVLLTEHVLEAMAHRQGRDLLIVDIAVPRDVDPQVSEIPGVHLYDIDDLGAAARSAAGCREAEVRTARDISQETADEFWQWLATREVVPLLAALQEHFERVRGEQLARFSGKMTRLSPSDRAWVEQLATGIIRRLLHEPAVTLKEELARGNVGILDAIACIFDLSIETAGGDQSQPRRSRPRGIHAPVATARKRARTPGSAISQTVAPRSRMVAVQAAPSAMDPKEQS